MQWHLDNGEDRHAENPETFELPAAWRRKALQPGEFAKLIFVTEEGGERMWVKVERISADGYIGSLANQPATIEDLEHGDPVAFKPEHVIDVHCVAE